MTNFITTEYLANDLTIAQFVRLVTDTFQKILNKYIILKNLPEDSIIFVYKGGNILRIISREFMRSIPHKCAELIVNTYYQYFKRSDADFSIYIDPSIEEKKYDEITKEITKITYKTIRCNCVCVCVCNSGYYNLGESKITADSETTGEGLC